MKKSLLSDVVRILPAGRRRKGVVIIALLVLGSVLDFFSLAFFLPLIFLLINPDNVRSHPLIIRIFELLNIESMTVFTLLVTGLVFLFLVAKTVFSDWISRQKAGYAYKVYSDIASRAVKRYLSLSHLEFTRAKLSEEVNLISYLPLVIANNVVLPAGTFLSEALVFLFLLAGVAWFDFPVFGLLFLILVPAYLLYRIRKKNLRSVANSIKKDYPLMVRYTLLIVEGLADIRSFNKEDYFKTKFESANRRLAQVFSQDQALHASTPRFTELIAGACIFVLITYALVTRQNQDEMILLLAVYAGVSFRIIPSINRMLATVQQMKVHEYAVSEFLDIQKDGRQNESVEGPPVPFHDKISFNHLSFNYPDHENIVNDLHFDILKGERVALTGRSGSGKTTILLLLLRLLREQKGRIIVDKTTLNEANEPEWRRKVGYVPQHPYILDGTIAQNIAFALEPEEIDNERISHLIKGLDLQPWLSTLPDGMQTRIGEKGAKISGGQRQRIAIARALYQSPEVLLLDEVTNQLDRVTEKEVIDLLFRISDQKCTLVMITHYPEFLDRFDSVYELIDGSLFRVRQQGVPASR